MCRQGSDKHTQKRRSGRRKATSLHSTRRATSAVLATCANATARHRASGSATFAAKFRRPVRRSCTRHVLERTTAAILSDVVSESLAEFTIACRMDAAIGRRRQDLEQFAMTVWRPPAMLASTFYKLHSVSPTSRLSHVRHALFVLRLLTLSRGHLIQTKLRTGLTNVRDYENAPDRSHSFVNDHTGRNSCLCMHG